jgi:hypothetical protein
LAFEEWRRHAAIHSLTNARRELWFIGMTSSFNRETSIFKKAPPPIRLSAGPSPAGCGALFALRYPTGAAHARGQKSWRHLDGHNQLPKLVLGVTFNNGIEVIAKPADLQPITAAVWRLPGPHQNLAIAHQSDTADTFVMRMYFELLKDAPGGTAEQSVSAINRRMWFKWQVEQRGV